MRQTSRLRGLRAAYLDNVDETAVATLADELDDLARAFSTSGLTRKQVPALAERVARAAEGVRAAAQRRSASPAVRLLALVVLRVRQLELAGVNVDWRLDPIPDGLALEVAEALEDAATCFVGNVLRHSRARDVSVSLVTDQDSVELIITDDGCGFDVEDVDHPPDAGDATPFYLRSVRAVVASAGGSTAITSAMGRGTTVAVRLPLRGDELDRLCSWRPEGAAVRSRAPSRASGSARDARAR
jgi:hypothetical protein